MKIPFNDFKKAYADKKNEVDFAIKKVLNSGYFILGKEVGEFEKKFASYVGTKYGIGVANGLETLQISLMALNIGPGDEVITTPHSAVATTLAIKAVGAKPVFVDTDSFYHIDVKKIEKVITKKTKAIIPVHLYGQSADIKKIIAIARKHKLEVVEDCAQAHGAECSGKKVGTFGKLGCFSFYPTKNLGGYGDGGMIVTNNKKIAEKCKMIRNYGQKNRYEHVIYGLNSRLDELQASVLNILLPYLDKENAKRIEIAKTYKKELSDLKEIKLPEERVDCKHVYHLFVIETEQRDKLQKYLKENGVDTLIHYPIPIHKQKCFPEFNKIKLGVTENKAKKILSIPCHPFLEKREVIYTANLIKSFFKDQ